MARIEPKTIVLLGVPFHDVTMEETLAEIDRIVLERTPRFIATANLDFASRASRDVELQRILMDAQLVLCDGTPLVWASRLLDAPLRERVAGSDLTPRLMAHSAQRGYRIFFLGSDETVLATARDRFQREYPGLVVCGIYAPPYAKLLEFDNEAITAAIRETRPDILLVAMGAPKQEKWIYMNHRELGIPCSIGIGASLDFVAGKFSRAPVWMQRSGLEWLFRLLQEPRRLFSRYYDNFTFLVSALLSQKRTLSRRPEAGSAAPSAEPVKEFVHFSWAGRADAAAALSGLLEVPTPSGTQNVAVLDLSAVNFMDSTGLGVIMKGYKLCKEREGGLILLNPSQPVRLLIETLKLQRLIPVASSEEELRRIAEGLLATAPLCGDEDETGRRIVFNCSGELTAANAPRLSELVHLKWDACGWARFIEVNLAAVHFIDSSGLDALVRARALAQSRRGGRFSIVGANENIQNVLKLGMLNDPLPVKPRGT
jgi:exopolysaccharide biosynthesis WecB/TagA/CpsF family protein/anti-anti-sigma factor